MRFARTLVCVVAAVGLLAAGPVEAASPGSGSLSKAKKKLSWKGSFVVSNPASTFAGCVDDTPSCDRFALKVNMGEGGKVKIILPISDPVTDLDMFVMDPNGAEVASGASGFSGETESLTFTHKKKFRNKPYDVQIVPFVVAPGTTYKATASITKFVK